MRRDAWSVIRLVFYIFAWKECSVGKLSVLLIISVVLLGETVRGGKLAGSELEVVMEAV